MEEYNFTLKNNVAEIEPLQGEITATLQAGGVRLHFIYALNLALGEWLENVIQYAFSDDGPHEIQVQFLVSEIDVRLRITDDGREFDPDLNRPARLSPPDGSVFASRGLHLIRSLMDEANHERSDGRNVLLMTKHLDR